MIFSAVQNDTQAMRREGIVHLLLAEDDEENRDATNRAFFDCRETIRLHTVTTAKGVMDFLSGDGYHGDAPAVSIVLVGNGFPDMPRSKLVQSLKADPSLRRITVVSLVDPQEIGGSAFEDITEFSDYVLVRPVTLESFARMIRAMNAKDIDSHF